MAEDTVTLECRFDLTDAEIAAAARKRAGIEADLAKLESAFGVEKEKHKKAAEKLSGAAGALGDLIRKGYELRPTQCVLQWDYATAEVRTVRLDTGEVVRSRPMTDMEKGKGPQLPFGPSIQLAETDPDVMAAEPDEGAEEEAPELPEDEPDSTDATAPVAGEPPADGTLCDGPAPTARKALLILPPRAPGFARALVIATLEDLQAVAKSEKARRIPQLAVAVKRELRRRADAQAPSAELVEAAALPADEPDLNTCEICGHAAGVHGDVGARGCMVEGCECRKLRLPPPDPDPLHLDGYDPKAGKQEAAS